MSSRTFNAADQTSVAVVGIGCRLPDAQDHRKFFANLLAGRSSIREISADRWDIRRFYSPDISAPGKSVSKWGGLIDHPYAFDHGFFRIPPREAVLMDPQQRLLLEEAWHCVEDAGISFGALRSARTAVYVGAMARDHLQEAAKDEAAVESHSGLGGYDSLLANRLSHILGLSGASMSIDAACASSLVAIHMAMQALAAGEADFALAGGVSLNLHPWKYISFSKARMLSPVGLCKTFSQDADGYVPGDGVAVVLLRRIEDAVRDGDHIYGVLTGSAVNHGGQRNTLTAPTVASQREVISEALTRAGTDPRTITYVEAHGTGTSLGDPIEAEALRSVYAAASSDRDWCALGSVKPNIGHLEAAAGVAGLIKVLMMMSARAIPPNIHISALNPLIDFDSSPFAVPRAPAEWQAPSQDALLRAGVSSFGMGGVNAHVIVEEYVEQRASPDESPVMPSGSSPSDRPRAPFMLSARTPEALDRLLRSWRQAAGPDGWVSGTVADICRTLATGREHMPVRVGTMVSDQQDVTAFVNAQLTIPARTQGRRWRLAVGRLTLPQRHRLKALLGSAAYSDVARAFKEESPQAATALRRLQQGARGPREEFLFTLLTLRALSRLGFAPDDVTGHSAGLWPTLAAIDALVWHQAADLAAGDKKTRLPRPAPPRIPFVEPATGRTVQPYQLDEKYFAALLDGLRLDPDEQSAVRDRAARLVDGQHTFRGHLAEWNRHLAARGLDALQLPMDGAAWHDHADGTESVVAALAVQHALDALSRKWELSGERLVQQPRLHEILDLLADQVLTPAELLQLVHGNEEERAAAARTAQSRASQIPRDGSYVVLRAHTSRSHRAGALRTWAEVDVADSAARHDGPTLWIGEAGTGGADDVSVEDPADLADGLARPLLDLWLRGVDIDWQLFHKGAAGRRLVLPTTEFVRSEHRAPSTTRESTSEDEAVTNPTTSGGPQLHSLVPEWVSEAGEPLSGADGPVLVVAPERLSVEVEAAAATGMAGRERVHVRLGQSFQHDGGTVWTVRPTEWEDWDRVFSTLEGRGCSPAAVVHAVAPADDTGLQRRLDETVHCAFLLAKAAVSRRDGRRCELMSVGAVRDGESSLELAAISGLARSLRRESTSVRLRTVALDTDLTEPAAWNLVAEEAGIEAASPVVRRTRRGARWEERYVDAAPGAPVGSSGTASAPVGIQPGGVYLITGGAGGIGLRLARHLLRVDGVRVVLVGRTDATGERLTGLEDLSSDAPERVAYHAADLSDLEQTNSMVKRVRAQFGVLSGVFHAAGVLRDGYLLHKTLQDVRDVLAPKIAGAVNLDRATRDDPLDFFVLISSLVAAVGNHGQTDYAAANAYLEAFAEERERRRQAGRVNGRTIAIAWPLWEGGGMTVTQTQHTVFRPEWGLEPMPAAVGLTALDRALHGGAVRHTFVFGNERAVDTLTSAPGQEQIPALPPVATGTRHEGDTVEECATRYMVGLFAELLGMPEHAIDVSLGFDEYGIDSILISQCHTRIEQDLGSVPQTLLFECRNLRQAAARVAGYRGAELAARYASADSPTPGEEPAPPRVTLGSERTHSAQHVGSVETGDRDIAVIGMAGRYPMAPDLEAFWDNLFQGRDSVTEIPVSRWDHRAWTVAAPVDEEGSGTYCTWGGFLENPDHFDPLFFNISPREAELMDPQERLFLQTAWTAFEDAGYPPHRLGDPDTPGSRAVGVFAGVTTQTYLLWGPDQRRAGSSAIPTSTQWSIANRVSYWLDLHGPSMPVDTACASSLSAVHLACQSLNRDECRLALVGGVNLYLHPSKYDWLCQMQMLSRSGKCHTFGADADGFVPGEGVGALVLKPLRDAVADGDRVLGVIKGSAVNHGGRTNGFTVPSPTAQAELVRMALEDAGVAPSSIGYVEAHGTGTALGDPIEIAGLTGAFAPGTSHPPGTQPKIAIGSVKTNIGHLEAAAGVAGLTKVLLQMQHGRLVPSLHAERENPRIDFPATPFRVQRTDSYWPPISGSDGRELPRRAGISSFGAGGANAHVIVEEYTGPQAVRGSTDGEQLIVVSAKDTERLREHCARLATALRRGGEHMRLSEVAYQLQMRRQPLPERLALLVHDIQELADCLTAVSEERPPGTRCWTTDRRPGSRTTAREAVADAVRQRNLSALAACWTAGADVPWADLHEVPLRHVELPSYPFAQESHWLPDVTSERTDRAPLPSTAENLIGSSGSHPFIGGVSDEGSATWVDFTGQEFFLDDHRVNGEPVFPAVGYLEMVRAAVEQRGHRVTRLRNNVWSSAITVAEPRRVHVALASAKDGFAYEVYGFGQDGERHLHGQGRVISAPVDQPHVGDEQQSLDVEEIKTRCTHRMSGGDFYPRIHDLGLQLGPSYQGIEELWVGETEALSRIRLPEPAGDGAERFHLHPSVLDSALQATLWLIDAREPDGPLHLPFTIGALDANGATPRTGYAHVTIRSWSDTAKKAEVRIADEEGRVVLHVRDFWLRPFQSRSAPRIDGVVGRGTFFRPAWEEQRLPEQHSEPGASAVAASATVVLAPSTEAGRVFATELTSWHRADHRIVTATQGGLFRVVESATPQSHVEMRPGAREDAQALTTILEDSLRGEAQGGALDVVFAWPRHCFTGRVEELDKQLSDGLHPLFHLVSALLASPMKPTVRILCAVPGGDGAQPGHAAIGGFLRTVSRESSRFSHCLVELPSAELTALAGGTGPAAARLVAELRDGPCDGSEVRHQHGRRYLRRWRTHEPLSAVASDAAAEPRTRGTYAITGGAGGLGALVARWLAARFSARVVLAGRSPLDQRITSLLADLRAVGGEARYVQTDVGTAEGAQALADAARSEFGSLNGVFHCAGVLRDDYLSNQDLQRIEQVVAPKARGAVHLDAVLRQEPLQFFCLFSSVAGPLGSAGQAGYAYANSFLDAFAEWREEQRHQGSRHGRTLSINWPLWREGGMGVDEEVEEWLRANLGLRPLETEGGLAALETALKETAGRLLFVEGDGAKVGRQLRATTPGDEGQHHDVEAPRSVDIASKLSDVLASEVARVVKLDAARIDPTAQIGDYGFDSLSFSRLANKLNETLDVDITPATFFEYPSIAELGAHLMEEFPAEVARLVAADGTADGPETVAEPTARTVPTTRDEPHQTPVASMGQVDAPVASTTEAKEGGREPIAIVGMHGMMPGSTDLDDFWRHVEAGDDLISEIPGDRWDWRAHYSPTGEGENHTVSKWGGFLHDVSEFDARFFGISPREAQLMDPQQRLFLQTVHAAIEEAGYQPTELARGKTGLFVGVATHDYYDLLREAGVPTEAYTTTGLFHAILANRVSYLLNLRGPSFPIDTACSSSLVAMRSAIESLWSGSCDVAIAGGVNLLLSPMIYISFSRAGMLSPDGRCKTFDAAADGYVRGEGVGAVLLKPLSTALRDGDHIHAVIRGSAVNHGGKVNTLTTPNPNAQSELIVSAFEEHGVDPESVGYMEIHGTGTALGDPIEINGLKKAFRELRDRSGKPRITQSCTAIGSVKPVIGHLEAAAGIAGVIKAILAMKHGKMPGSPHIVEMNPHIQLDGSPLRIPRRTEPWPRRTAPDGTELPRRAGVSSFGFGGVNGHILLEEHLATEDSAPPPVAPQGEAAEHVFVLSARTDDELRRYARDLSQAVAGLSSAADTPHSRTDSANRIRAELAGLVAESLGVRPDEVPVDEPVADLGLGTLGLHGLREWLHEHHSEQAGDDASIVGWSLSALARRLVPETRSGKETGAARSGTSRDVAHTLQLGRRAMPHRLAVVCRSTSVLAERLLAFAEGPGPSDAMADTFHGVVEDGGGAAVRPSGDDPRATARQWVEGCVVEWHHLYEGQHPRRLSLPTYPFARTRFWIPGSVPRDRVRTVRRRIESDDPLVADHRIHGQQVLPGVGHIELAHAALGAPTPGSYRLTRAVWLRPLTVDPPGREIAVRLREKHGSVEYEISAADEAGAAVIMSRGEWQQVGHPQEERPPADVETIRRRCAATLDQETVYANFRRLGLDYGAFFQGVEQVWIGAGELLASITGGAGRERAEGPPQDPAFPPTLMDAALQAVSTFGFAGHAASRRTPLPFSLESATLLGPLPDTGFAHVRTGDEDTFDIDILNRSGRVCAELRGLSVRQEQPQQEAAPSVDVDLPVFYEPHWAPLPAAPADPRDRSAPRDGVTLIVHPARCFGLDRALAAREEQGNVRRLVLGLRTRRIDASTWEVDATEPRSLVTCLREAGPIHRVWFLGGVLEADPASPAAGPDASRPDPTVLLFHLFRALWTGDRTTSPHTLTVVVNDVHDVDGRRIGNPYAAGLSGLRSSLAEEFPAVDITCVDVGLQAAGRATADRIEALVDMILEEPAHRGGEEVAFCAGRRYVRQLRRLTPGTAGRTALRQGGTYLVVGGTGGIGSALALHLAATLGARIVLIGRRPEGAETSQLLERIAEAGGEAVYLPADVTDRAGLSKAIDDGRRRFGRLHGVFDAAMVLRDGIMERMDADAFHAVYDPKALGSRLLGELLADEPLDFLLFLSSVQSFTGSAGQANYAAASTAQDGFARALAAQVRYPVHIVNLGPWSTVGAVADAEHRRALTARGFQPLETASGIAAIERVLAGGRRQVVVIDADEQVLQSMGVTDDGLLPFAGVVAQRPVDDSRVEAEDREETRALEEFIALALCARLKEAGHCRRPGDAYPQTGWRQALGALPAYERLADALGDILVRHGFLSASGGRLTATPRVVEADPQAVEQRGDQLLRSRPNVEARLGLVRTCLRNLPAVLAGELSATEVLFPGGSPEHVARIYRGERLVDHCNRLVAEQVTAAARETAAGRAVRILEIGAGTGATTDEVLSSLSDAGVTADYVFTDVSVRFLKEAEQRLRPVGVRMAFDLLDIARPLEGQGDVASRSYDVVVAANVLHATGDLDAALHRVRDLLVPGGRVVLTEVTNVLAFHTVTFGLLDGWWPQEDEHRRLAHSPLLDEEMWQRRLELMGFTGVRLTDDVRFAGGPSQRVLVAQKPNTIDTPVPAARPQPVAATTMPVVKRGELLTAQGDEQSTRRLVAGLIRDLAADILGMAVAELETDKPLSSFGVDSIVGVELINKINDRLGVVLKTIAVFDYPTVDELAGFIVDRHTDAAAAYAAEARGADLAGNQDHGGEPDDDSLTSTPHAGRTAMEQSVVTQQTEHHADPPTPSVGRSGAGFRAVRFERPGSPRDLRIADITPRAPGPGEVEVQVKAFPINFSDFLLAKGLYPMMPDFPFTPGVEVSGIVRRVGPGVQRVAVGDEVIALTRPEMGGQASVVLTDDTFVVHKPANVTHEEACGVPVAYLAMSLAMERAQVQPGERVLIQAATGTNGLMAVQLAQLAGAEIIATAGSRHKVAYLERLGLRDAIDHRSTDVAAEVLRRTDGVGVDVVINTLGDGAVQQGLNLLAPEGRYVEIAVFGLQAAGALDLSRLIDNQSFHSFNTKKYLLKHPEQRVPRLEALAAQLEAGKVRPVVAHVLPFDRVVDAYALKEDRETVGRVVVSVPDPGASAVTTAQDISPERRDVSLATPAAPTQRHGSGDIAIIGMSGRYAGAADIDALWENLARGLSAVRDVPGSRWSNEQFLDPDPTRLDTTYCGRGAFLDDVDAFDAPFFRISGKEAAQMDPQQRLFLEEAWKTLEDAGYPAGTLSGEPCGVFVGVGPSEYLTRMNKAGVVKEAQSFWGNEASVLASRISYFLNLKGPSVAINTACSSSLVALHLACQSLLGGECRTAIAGGVFLTLAPDYFVVASNGNMLAPDGTCKTFDASADGFGPGEGVGALLLKPLADALRDRDHIHGVIKGSAINQDGRTNGITAPNGPSQTAVETAAYERAGVDPATIGYVEAHGTGTKLGDPIEVEALTEAFRRYTDRTGYCAIGSIKTNIGHTAAAAGIAGVIKALLAFRHRRIPPSLHYDHPNPLIDFPSTPFYVNTELRDWEAQLGRPRRAAVSSFGFSGTNAHVVLEEPTPTPRTVPAERAVVAVPLSAHTPQALRARQEQLADWLEGAGSSVPLTAVSYQLQIHRDHFRERAVHLVRDRRELVDALRRPVEEPSRPGRPDGADTATVDLAARYALGEDADWASLWDGEDCGRLPMPTYPFDRHRYWYTEEDVVYGVEPYDSPRFHRGTAPDAEVTVMTATLTGEEFFLSQHRVGERGTLPAVMFPELALRAGREAGLPSGSVTGLHLLKPLVVHGTPVDLAVHLTPSSHGTAFDMLTTAETGDAIVHARGTLQPRRTAATPEAPVDLMAVVARCPETVSVEENYRLLVAMGLRHGPALAALRDIRAGADTVLARLRLPEGTAWTQRHGYTLHPALLDGALQALGAFPHIRNAGHMEPLFPIALGEVTPRAPELPAECLAVITARSTDPAVSHSTFDVQLLTDDGQVLALMSNVTVKLPGRRGGAERAADGLRAVLHQLRDGEIDESQAEAAMEAFLAE